MKHDTIELVRLKAEAVAPKIIPLQIRVVLNMLLAHVHVGAVQLLACLYQ